MPKDSSIKPSRAAIVTRQFGEVSRGPGRVFLVGTQINVGEIESRLGQDFPVTHHNNGADFIAADHGGQIGCLVVEGSSEGSIPSELLEHIKSEAHRLALILLADAQQVRLAVQAFRAGAHDVLQKPAPVDQIVEAVHSAMVVLASQPMSQAALERQAAVQAVAALTDRQRDILERVVDGQSSKAIAAAMGVSQRTIDNHRATIMKRLRASSVPALIQMAIAARGRRTSSAAAED